MSSAKSKKVAALRNSIKTLEDLRGRCWINRATGCWEWRGALASGAPRTYFIDPVTGEGRIIAAVRAAWILAGNKEPEGDGRVFRYACRCDTCVNPEHARSGSRKEHGEFMRESKRMVGNPLRIAANRRVGRLRSKMTPEKVRDVLTSEARNRDLAKLYGVTDSVISRIRRGKVFKEVEASFNSSVFVWRPRA